MTYTMEPIVNGLKPLTVVTKSTISDAMDVVDLLPHSLITYSFSCTTRSYKRNGSKMS